MLGIAGFVIMIAMTVQTYKTARNTGRNAGLWALTAFGVGFTFQFIIPFVIGMVLGIVLVMQGTTNPVELQSKILGPATILGIICLVLSIVGMWLVFRHVSTVPDAPFNAVPPPPPTDL